MARNPKPAIGLGPLHLSQPSPLDLFGETQIKRRFVIIPKDQQALLQRPESWARFLDRSPKPFLNVPPEVLKVLKEHHQQLQAPQPEEPATTADLDLQADILNQDEPHSQVLHSEPYSASDDNVSDDDGGGGEHEDEAGSDNDSENAYHTPSPPQNKYPPQRPRDVVSQQRFISQSPSISPPGPTMPDPPKLQTLLPFSASSQDQEEALDVEVPTAVGESIPFEEEKESPTRACATPFSAQVVPCTYEQSEQFSAQLKMKSKQPIRDDRTNFSLPQRNLLEPSRPNITGPSFHEVINSVANTCSSIVPSTPPIKTPRRSSRIRHTDQTLLLAKDPDPSHQDIDAPGHSTSHRHSPEYKAQSPPIKSSPPTLHSALHLLPSPTPQPAVASQAPFTRYTLTYPHYTGSIDDFVTACMYIQHKQRKIRTSLYDDFIRAWHEGYVPYVMSCDNSETPVKVLGAIDWYNQIDDDPVYTSRVVTRQNLESTLNSYPDELRKARKLWESSSKSSQNATSTPDTAPSTIFNTSSTNDPIIEPTDFSRRSSILTRSDIIKDESNTTSPAAIPTLMQSEETKVISVHRSMSEIERGPNTAKGLTRALSDAVHHKRKASEDLNVTLPKRFSVNSLSRSDLGSDASETPEASGSKRQNSVTPSSQSGRKKKYANDPVKRSQAFAKFVKRQIAKDNIASSAPASDTPTSAQRQ